MPANGQRARLEFLNLGPGKTTGCLSAIGAAGASRYLQATGNPAPRLQRGSRMAGAPLSSTSAPAWQAKCPPP